MTIERYTVNLEVNIPSGCDWIDPRDVFDLIENAVRFYESKLSISDMAKGITIKIMSPEKEGGYKGYMLDTWEDEDGDCKKLIHDVITPEGKVIYIDWTPYETPTFNEFKKWVDMGCPTRYDFNMIGPFRHDNFGDLSNDKKRDNRQT